MNNGSWTQYEKDFLSMNIGKIPLFRIAECLQKSENAVKLYIFRHKIGIPKIKNNILIKILTIKFTDPKYFKPDRAFYKDVGMTSHRWYNVYFGRDQITEIEYKNICNKLNISEQDAFDARQLSLF